MVLMAPAKLALVLCLMLAPAEADLHGKHDHHKHHHHKHHMKHNRTAVAKVNATKAASKQVVTQQVTSKTVQEPAAQPAAPQATEQEITGKMKQLEEELAKKEASVSGVVQKGQIEVNGPLPADFAERFAQAVAEATGCMPTEVRVIDTSAVTAL